MRADGEVARQHNLQHDRYRKHQRYLPAWFVATYLAPRRCDARSETTRCENAGIEQMLKKCLDRTHCRRVGNAASTLVARAVVVAIIFGNGVGHLATVSGDDNALARPWLFS